MKVLIYKRTHKGDPDKEGVFGIQDCMGRIRNWNFDAVIGIGGKSSWKGHEDIKYKINWIGINPKKIGNSPRGRCLVFEHFELHEQNGLNIEKNFPELFKYMYGSRKRFDMSPKLPDKVHKEVLQILDAAKKSPKSAYYDNNKVVFSKKGISVKNKGGCDCAIKIDNTC